MEAEVETYVLFSIKVEIFILVENIHFQKFHINEICEDCLKVCICKILFVFKLDMFKNKSLYFWQDFVGF
jgi:hypothetical protein